MFSLIRYLSSSTNNYPKRLKPSDIRIRTPYNRKPSWKTQHSRHLLKLSSGISPENNILKKSNLISFDIPISDYNQEIQSSKLNQFPYRPSDNSNQTFLQYSTSIHKLDPKKTVKISDLSINTKPVPSNSDFTKVKSKTETLPALNDPQFLAQKKKKNLIHKQMWQFIKRRKWQEWQKSHEEMKAHQLQPDEVSYTLILHGMLAFRSISSNEAKNVFNEMKLAGVHPALVNLNKTLLEFYFSMQELGIMVTDQNWIPIIRSTWLLAALIRGRRERYIARKLHMTELNIPKNSNNLLFELNNLDTSEYHKFIYE